MPDNGATFPRVHVWADNEDVNASDLNAEFNNILSNLDPTGVGSHEVSSTEMRKQTDPGSFGAEVLASSLATEVEQLRFALSRLISGVNSVWYDAPAVSISGINTLLNATNQIPANRIQSGRTRSATDAFPIFLQADGTLAKVVLKGASTPFVYFINGTAYTISTDVPLSGMSLAPATQNTALVNDTGLTGQTDSLYAGERDAAFPQIIVDTVGTSVSSLVGSFAAFYHGATREYFVAYVDSATVLSRAMRGLGFDHSDAPIIRQALSDDDTLTLCRLHWIYATTAGAITTSLTNPTISATTPSAPNNGDYWFDLTNQTWKTFNGAAFIPANATLIGIAIADTAGVKAARSFDFSAAYSALNTVQVQKVDNATAQSLQPANRVSVAGVLYSWPTKYITWSTASNMASGVVLAINTTYYLYITERGDVMIDSERPYDRSGDFLGLYHPYHLWRSVGIVSTDGSSHLNPILPVTSAAASLGMLAQSPASGGSLSGIGNTSYATYVNQKLTLVTKGGAVRLNIIASGGIASCIFNNAGNFGVRILRDGTDIVDEKSFIFGGGVGTASDPISIFNFTDLTAPAGKHTYELQFKTDNSGNTYVLDNIALFAQEFT